MNIKNMTAKEIHDYIMEHTKSIEDDEWLEISNWINEFLKSNPSSEEERMFVPLGCAERVTIICDGIVRWRNSICIKCQQQSGHEKFCCSVYQKNEKHLGGIPNEIWAKENANCPYFQETYKEAG